MKDWKVFTAGIVAGIIVLCGMYATGASAQAQTWVPGTPTYIEEQDASDLIEHRFDWAYCQGIPRFGHRGEFPYDEYVVFDCDMKLNGAYCTNWRVKAIKGRSYGYFRLKEIRKADCF